MVEFSPYAYEFHEDPYPIYRRLREEAPVYYNAELDFWALSRHVDVLAAFKDPKRLHAHPDRREECRPEQDLDQDGRDHLAEDEEVDNPGTFASISRRHLLLLFPADPARFSGRRTGPKRPAADRSWGGGYPQRRVGPLRAHVEGPSKRPTSRTSS